MNRFINWLLGIAPIAGTEYFLGDEKIGRTLKQDDIKNGVVRIEFSCLRNEYHTYSNFHLNYKERSNTLRGKFDE